MLSPIFVLILLDSQTPKILIQLIYNKKLEGYPNYLLKLRRITIVYFAHEKHVFGISQYNGTVSER